MAVKDFQASQIRVDKLIGSGSGGRPPIMIYSASDATDYIGGLSALFTSEVNSNVGSDVFMYVSGSKSAMPVPGAQNQTRSNVTLFGGDLVVSGTLFAERTVVEVDLNTTGSLTVSGSVFVNNNVSIKENLYVTGTAFIGGASFDTLTSGRVVLAGTTGSLEDSANLAYNKATGQLGVSGSAAFSFKSVNGGNTNTIELNSLGTYLTASNESFGLKSYKGLEIQKGADSSNYKTLSLRTFDNHSFLTFDRTKGSQEYSVIQAINEAGNDQSGYLVLSSAYGVQFASGDEGYKRFNTSHSDTNFFVSGTVGSKDSATKRGTAVFVGDVVISGSLYDAAGVPISGGGTGGGDAVGWFSGSSATHANLGLQPNWISTSGSLAVSGTLVVGTSGVGSDVTFYRSNATTKGFQWKPSSAEYGALFVGSDGEGVDLIVYGDTSSRYLWWDQSEDTLKVFGEISQKLGNATFNESAGAYDFRVESLSKNNAFLVSGATNQVLILSGGSAASKDEAAGLDVTFYVSGTVGNKNSASHRGTSVFGGDVVTSGSFYVQDPNRAGRNLLSVASVTDGGNADSVGISVSVPKAKLHVSGTSTFTTVKAESTNVSGSRAMFWGVGKGGIDDYHTSNLMLISTSGSSITSNQLGNKKFQNGTAADTESAAASFNAITSWKAEGATSVSAQDFHIAYPEGALSADSLYIPAFTLTSGSGPSTSGAQVFILSGSSRRELGSAPNPRNFSDTNFWVSGSVGSKNTTTRGTAVFGGDVVISGALHGGSPLKIGSDARLIGGSGTTQYLNFGPTDDTSGYGFRSNAGSMEFKSSGGSWATFGAAGAGTAGITIVSGSVTTGSVTSLNLDMLGYVMNLGGGTIALTGTLGAAEEGTYSDGLFSTWHENTRIGVAIDKINEVLKYLSPVAAPELDNINSLSTGATSKLSFGSSNAVGGYSSVGTGAGLGVAVDVNGSYLVTTSSNNIRLATFDGSTSLTGILNSDVSENAYNNGVINHSGSAFNDANEGVISLLLNGVSFISVDLTADNAGSGNPGSGTGSSLIGGTGFFELSQTGSAYQSSNAEFGLFKNRTGKFQVHPSHMRNGWNFARVTHVIGTNTKTTNYVEWVTDASGSAIQVNSPRLSGEGEISLGGSVYLSGIHYATGANGLYKADILNYYENVFTNDTITFGQTNCVIPSQSVPSTSGATGSNVELINLTGSFVTNTTEMLGETISVDINVDHVLKANVVNGGALTSDRFLIFNASNTSTSLVETFNRENLRLQSGSFDSQGSAASSAWDSTIHVTSTPGYSDGLVYYDNRLYAPTNTLNSGDFRSQNDAGVYFGDGYSYDGNPNYSTLTSGLRTFYRPFVNGTGDNARDFDITITGAGSTQIVPNSTSITGETSKIRVHAKIPGKTGWLDLGATFLYNTGTDYAGGRIGSLDATIDSGGAVNHFSFGTGSISNTEHVVLKIEADSSWSGHLEDITVSFPAVGITDVPEAPDVGNASCDDTGADAKLSFGPSKTISGYTDVGDLTGQSLDLNGSYIVASIGSNLRRGVFSGTTDINGIINDATTQSGNAYPDNAFGTALTGTLALEVNGVTLVSTDLRNVMLGSVGNDSVVNGNGSGFVSVSLPSAGKDGSLLPDYRRFYRTGNWNVDNQDQRDGWNYAKVVHSQSLGSNVTTNYVEWINDVDSNPMAIDNAEYSTYFSDDVYYYQSGVKYFINPTGSVGYRVTNGYTNVYSNSSNALSVGSLTNLTVTRMETTGSGVVNSAANASSLAMPNLNTDANSQTLPISVTGSVSFSRSESLPGTWGSTGYGISATCNASHPIDSNQATSISKSNFLVYSGTLTNGIYTSNTTTLEVFGREDYRLQSGSYNIQDSTGSLGWDSTVSLESGGSTYNTGLLSYNNRVCSPQSSNLPDSGDFRDTTDSGTLTSAADNVDYSTLSNSERNYYRAFTNNTTSDQADIAITLYGDATLVPRIGSGSGTPGANKYFHMDIKVPGKTGWMDAARPAGGSIVDGSGALAGDRDGVVDGSGATNISDFQTAFIAGTAAVSGAEHCIIRIVADKAWTGYISRITIVYG